jgi:hypothetical protein
MTMQWNTRKTPKQNLEARMRSLAPPEFTERDIAEGYKKLMKDFHGNQRLAFVMLERIEWTH